MYTNSLGYVIEEFLGQIGSWFQKNFPCQSKGDGEGLRRSITFEKGEKQVAIYFFQGDTTISTIVQEWENDEALSKTSFPMSTDVETIALFTRSRLLK